MPEGSAVAAGAAAGSALASAFEELTVFEVAFVVVVGALVLVGVEGLDSVGVDVEIDSLDLLDFGVDDTGLVGLLDEAAESLPIVVLAVALKGEEAEASAFARVAGGEEASRLVVLVLELLEA